MTVLTMMDGREPALVIPPGTDRASKIIGKKAVKHGLETIQSGPDLPLVDEDSDLRIFLAWHS